jgi:hypothetical protein
METKLLIMETIWYSITEIKLHLVNKHNLNNKIKWVKTYHQIITRMVNRMDSNNKPSLLSSFWTLVQQFSKNN